MLKIAGNQRWAGAGGYDMPIVVMTPNGAGIRGSLYHSHSFDATATRLPGWKIVMPSTPRDAYGLMLSAILDPNPVMFMAPKALMRAKSAPGEEVPGEPEERALNKMIDAPLGDRSKWEPQWPDTPDLFIPIGQAKTVRRGRDVTVVAYGRMVAVCTKAAEELAKDGIEVEVIDLRSIYPYDWECLKESITRTNRVCFVNEDTEVTNFGEHLVRRTVEELFYHLHAPPKLLAGANVPGIGLADNLEAASVPQLSGIVDALRTLARHQP
jgi:2-oxoisovalerate dehydrogenase E1 component beta subunit